MVNAQDFTYSKGYLGLLSAVGASFAVFFCCARYIYLVYNHLREALPARRKKAVAIDMENAIDVEMATTVEDPDGTSLAMTENSAAKAHGRSARWSVDGCAANANPPPYGGLRRNHTF